MEQVSLASRDLPVISCSQLFALRIAVNVCAFWKTRRRLGQMQVFAAAPEQRQPEGG